MTTEEKAKAYDEALNWMRELYPGLHGATKEDAEHYFPELRESEEERIKRELIEYLKGDLDDITTDDTDRWINWIEKQKELPFVKDVMLGYPGLYFYDGERMHFQGPAMEEKQKENPKNAISIPADCALNARCPYKIHGDEDFIGDIKDTPAYHFGFDEGVRSEREKQKEQKPEIKYVYPKFRKGDVIEPITSNGLCVPVRVVDIWDGSYSCKSDDNKAHLSLPIRNEDKYRLVEQKPAEKQDYSGLTDLERAIHRGFLSAGVENVPVTIIKETANECKRTQTIANENANAGWSEKYIADVFEKVGLAKIVREQGNDALTNTVQSAMIELSKAGNAEWSEEDERMRNQLIYDVEHHKKEGLISAKQNKATKALYNGIEKCYDEKIAWLQSLRPQPHWKPSEEDIKMLEHIIGQYETGNKNSNVMGYLPRVEELSFLKRYFQNGKTE